ncbi:MAG: phage integrase N-terminal SAM-like domain-containing protein [Bacteroidota bacterium]
MFFEREASRNKVKLLDQIRISLRTNHYSRKTEESYTQWIKQFIIFNNKTHTGKLDKEEILLLFWARAKQHC